MAQHQSNLPVRRTQGSDLSPFWEGSMFRPMDLIASSPWQMMRQMQEEMDRLFGSWMSGPSDMEMASWSPNVDVSEDEKEWCIDVDLPGVNRDDIEVQVQNNMLRIRAEMRQEEPVPGEASQEHHEQARRQYLRRERRYGYFERSFPLPENVNEEAICCEFKNGVLTCHLPKIEQAAALSRHIPITDGASAGEPISGASSAPQGGATAKAAKKKAA